MSSCTAKVEGGAAAPGLPEAAPLTLPPAGGDAVRTAWVFSSGGPRGFVHIGVIKGLAALGLQPDLVVGSSVGALAGTLCAAGLDAGRIEELALSVQPWDLLRLNLRGPGWLSGAGMAALVRDALGGRGLQDLPVPMACVAVRLDDREVVAFTRGDAGLAVQASTAIVGRLAPVPIRGARYADLVADADGHRLVDQLNQARSRHCDGGVGQLDSARRDNGAADRHHRRVCAGFTVHQDCLDSCRDVHTYASNHSKVT